MMSILANIASPAPNAKYGAEHLLRFILSMCHKNTYAATAFRAMKRRRQESMDNHRYLQLLGSVSPGDVLEMCLDMMEGVGQFIANTGMLAEYITLTIDEHLIPRHDKNKKENSDLKCGRRKSGTNHFEGYITGQVVS